MIFIKGWYGRIIMIALISIVASCKKSGNRQEQIPVVYTMSRFMDSVELSYNTEYAYVNMVGGEEGFIKIMSDTTVIEKFKGETFSTPCSFSSNNNASPGTVPLTGTFTAKPIVATDVKGPIHKILSNGNTLSNGYFQIAKGRDGVVVLSGLPCINNCPKMFYYIQQ